MSDVLLSLVMAECKRTIEACEGDIKAKLHAAMKAALDHWMVTDKEMQFKGAVGAVMSHYGKDSPEWKRIETELTKIRQLNAFLAAASSGLRVDLPETQDDQHEPLGLVGMWRDIQKEAE